MHNGKMIGFQAVHDKKKLRVGRKRNNTRCKGDGRRTKPQADDRIIRTSADSASPPRTVSRTLDALLPHIHQRCRASANSSHMHQSIRPVWFRFYLAQDGRTIQKESCMIEILLPYRCGCSSTSMTPLQHPQHHRLVGRHLQDTNVPL
jgi:hypothetical protein